MRQVLQQLLQEYKHLFLVGAGQINTSGLANTAVGYDALVANTTSSYNTAVGVQSLFFTTGANNTAVGVNTGYSINTGANNTALGYYAMNNGLASDISSSFNTAIGSNSGTNITTGGDNTFLGHASNMAAGTYTNAGAIGAYAFVGQSNALVLGSNIGTNGATASTFVGIGNPNPGAKLSFNDLTDGTNGPDGITWYSPAATSYGIFRSAGPWTGPNYQQLTQSWQTGIIIDGGSLYGLSGTLMQPTAGNVGIGQPVKAAYNLEVNGSFGFGDGTVGSYRSRTESRADAGLMASQSGFFQTSAPSPGANWHMAPAGVATTGLDASGNAQSWWHLIDSRHSNNANNYALQIAGSFFDQYLYYRKTNNNGAQAWSQLLSSANYPVSVSLAADYVVNTAAWTSIGAMTVTFTATKPTALIQFTTAGLAYTNSMAYVQFRIWNSTTGVSMGGTGTGMQSYDNATGTITPWSCSFSKNITGLTVGTSYTLIVQGQRSGILGTWDAIINAGSVPDQYHMTLTVFP